MIHTNELVFDLQGFKCGGDLRITVFQQHKMMQGIKDGLCLADVSPTLIPLPLLLNAYTSSSSLASIDNKLGAIYVLRVSTKF